MELTANDIQRGKTYRAKKFVGTPTCNNDRKVVYVSTTTVQYDSDTVKNGRHYPTVSMEKFLKWVSREVSQHELDVYFGRVKEGEGKDV